MAMDPFRYTYRLARRIVIGVVGTTILLVGVVMVFMPGPAMVVIPAGLAILGIEFAWARVWLRKVREKISEAASEYRGERAEQYRRSDDIR